ncbi:MAG: LLM class flavin-dependent oxidoreductase [Acidobacteria bacterium]|nr:MAG: LLM class flavin-dependent oxidoreductase [Acidobacteriota bacterium]
MPLRLGVLDQAPIAAGSTGAGALRNSIDLARLADELGYRRYWVAEHHGTPMLACASPEALIAPIACATTRIRVGSGGVMLPHYSPLKVAETYSMLSGIFPARIDLGVGRAPGSDPLTAFALQRDRRQASPDDFPQQLEELLAYLHDALPPRHQFARLSALPGRPERPDVWLLGSSPQSGSWAAELGLPYAFADFINPHGAEIVERYRRDFRTLTISTTADTEDMEQQTGSNLRAPRVGVGESRPRVIVAGWALCADTDEEAERLGASARMAFAMLLGGQPIPVPPVDEALRFLEEHGAAAESLVRRRRWIVGSPPKVRAGLEALAEEYGADEVMIVTITHDHDARRRSYELIARAFT